MTYSYSISRILFALLLVSMSQCLIPEVNIAASTPVLNQELAKNIGPKVTEIILNTTINETFTESASYGAIKVQINMSDIKVTDLEINWKANILVPKSEYTFRINMKGITAEVNSHVEGHVSLKKMNTTLDMLLSDINGYVDLKLSSPKSSSGVGFDLQITYIEIQIDDINITFTKDPIDTYVAQTAANLIRKSIPQIINSLVQKQINPLLQNYCNSRSFVTAEIGNHLYEINLNTTEVPRFINLTYMAIPLDVIIFNVDTGKYNDQIDNDRLPLKPYNETDTLEITLSSGMINTILWLIQDSNVVDLYINNTMIEDVSPINLNTTDLAILLPEMTKLYGKTHGVYLHITMSTKTPGLYIRGGRLLVSTAVNIQFIVDIRNDLYPRNITDCFLATECFSAVTLNVSLVLSTALKVNHQNRLFATVQTVKVIEAKRLESSQVPVNEEGLKKILNTLIPSMVMPINQQLRQGIEIPMSPTFGYNVTNIMMKTELDYLAAAIKFDFGL